MDVAAFNSLPEDLREAAVASFIAFRDKYHADSQESQSKLEEAIKIAEEREREFNSDIANREKYENLIALIGNNSEQPESDEGGEGNGVEEESSSGAVEVLDSRKRIKYGSVRPKDKLTELIETTAYFRTDEELVSKVRQSLGIDGIPFKTVQNNLYELISDNLAKRFRIRIDGVEVSLNGRFDMFDENGNPKPEFFKPKIDEPKQENGSFQEIIPIH